jgi:hypothetical protein
MKLHPLNDEQWQDLEASQAADSSRSGHKSSQDAYTTSKR